MQRETQKSDIAKGTDYESLLDAKIWKKKKNSNKHATTKKQGVAWWGRICAEDLRQVESRLRHRPILLCHSQAEQKSV